MNLEAQTTQLIFVHWLILVWEPWKENITECSNNTYLLSGWAHVYITHKSTQLRSNSIKAEFFIRQGH